MRSPTTKRSIFALMLLGATLGACTGQDPASSTGEDCQPGQHCPIVGELEELFVPEPYGVSMEWFDYQQRDHTILPIPGVYRVRSGAEETLLTVESYYNGQGESGHFSLRGLRVGAPVAEIKTIEFDKNSKKNPVCFELAGWQTVDCETEPYDLVFRTERRVVATAGFAVVNPAIFSGAHFSDAEPGEIWHGEFASIEAALEHLDASDRWARVPNAQIHPTDALLYPDQRALQPGEASNAYLQASSAMKLIGWTFEETAEPDQILFSATCVALKSRARTQKLPLSSQSVENVIEFEPDTVTLVSLCAEDGPAAVESSDLPYRGLWPASTTYDLAVDTLGDSPRIRVAPGHFIWSSGQKAIDDTLEIPSGLWESDFSKF